MIKTRSVIKLWSDCRRKNGLLFTNTCLYLFIRCYKPHFSNITIYKQHILWELRKYWCCVWGVCFLCKVGCRLRFHFKKISIEFAHFDPVFDSYTILKINPYSSWQILLRNLLKSNCILCKDQVDILSRGLGISPWAGIFVHIRKA